MAAGDQRVFVSEIGKAGRELGWKPTVAPGEGVKRLDEWVGDNEAILRDVVGQARPGRRIPL